MEKRSMYGIALNVGVCVGLLLSSVMGLALPKAGTHASQTT